MDAALFERLLREDESETLDFKKQQYAFSKATDHKKSELLKDILGFANAWRRTDAYILIGVDEVRGGRSRVIGIADHLEDHVLQQFVHSRTNRRVSFGYRAYEFEGKQVGVIVIDQRERPVWLKAGYGKLRKEQVYVRRGSSTNPEAPANPDEIAAMRQQSDRSSPNLLVAFAHPEREQIVGATVVLRSENCCMPAAGDIPEAASENDGGYLGPMSSFTHTNSDYYLRFAEYIRFNRMAHQIRVALANQGKVEARGVLVECLVPKGGPVGLHDSAPPTPRRTWSTLSHLPHLDQLPISEYPGHIDIDEDDDRYRIQIHFLDLQPGRRVLSDAFYLTVASAGTHQLQGQVYAANLPEAAAIALAIQADVEHTSMTVDQLVGLADSRKRFSSR